LPNEPEEKVTVLKTASSAGSKIGNHFLSLRVLGLEIGPVTTFEKGW